MLEFKYSEGPVLEPIIVTIMFLVSFVCYRVARKIPLKLALSNSSQSMRTSLRPPASSLYLIGFMLILYLGFFLASASFDFIDKKLTLFGYAFACWVMFLFTIYSFYDLICFLASKKNINLKTNILGVDALIGFLIGERALTFLQYSFAGFGFSTATSICIGISIFWATLRVYSYDRPSANTIHEKEKTSSINKAKLKNALPTITALSIIVLYLLWTTYFNSFRPMSAWDNYTQWLIVPYEILFNDKIIGFYETTRSVAPAYSPHQSISSAFLLYLWGDASLSENILNAYNPFLLCLGVWAIVDFFSRESKGLLSLTIAICAVTAIMYLPVTYRLSGYTDTRSIVTLLVVSLVLLKFRNFSCLKTAFALALLSTVVFTCKPYIWPFAGLPIVFYILNGFNWRAGILFTTYVVLFAFIDILPIQLLAPEVQVTNGDSVSARLFDTIQSILSIKPQDIQNGIEIRPQNTPTLIGFSVFSTAFFLLGVFSWKKPLVRDSFFVCAFIIFGLITLLLIVLSETAAFGNSFSRYLLNASGVLLLGSTFLLHKVTSIKFTTSLRLACVAGSLFLTIMVLPKSAQYIETQWYAARIKHLKPFPERNISEYSDFAKIIETYTSLDENQRILVHPFKTNIEQYYLNYLLTRSSKNVSSLANTTSGGPAAPLINTKSLIDLEMFIDNIDVDLIMFRQDVVILGKTIAAGAYTKFELIRLLETESSTPQDE